MALPQMYTRTVYSTERIRIDRISDRYSAQYALYLDNSYYSTYPTMNEAEHEAAVQMDQEAHDLAATLADEAAEYPVIDDCELCGNVTASVTVRTSYGAVRVCGGCYTRHYDENENSSVAWEADFDERPAIIVAERDRCIVVEADGREWVYALEVDGACRAAQRIAALEQAGYRLEAA